MLSYECLFECLPADGIFTGVGLVQFTDPDGEVGGLTTVTLSADGDVSLKMEVEDSKIPPEFEGLLISFLEGALPVTQNPGVTSFAPPTREHTLSRITVQTEHGIFSGTRGFISHSEYSDHVSLTFAINDLVFVRVNPSNAAYWFLPLLGDFSDYAGTATVVDNPVALPGKVIPFVASGIACGLQPLRRGMNAPFATLTNYGGLAFGEVTGPSNSIGELMS